MKKCGKCGASKSADCFHKRKASNDGLSAICKECQSVYDKARAMRPDRVAARNAYQKTEKGAAAVKRAKEAWAERNKGKIAEITKNYREQNPKKYRAHSIVSYAIRSGNLHPEPCESCGFDGRTHAHHDDYDKPLNVRWLCPACHIKWHAENGEGLNA